MKWGTQMVDENKRLSVWAVFFLGMSPQTEFFLIIF